MTVRQLKGSLTQEDFDKWRYYDSMEPLHGVPLSLAQLGMMISAFMGSKNTNFEEMYINKSQAPNIQEKTRDDGAALNNALVGLFS